MHSFVRSAPGILAAIALLLSAPAAGCLPHHVQLTAPPVDAPLHERQAAYRRLSPRTMRTVVTIAVQNDRIVRVGSVTTSLRLRGGALVREADDLLAVVRDESLTAAYARRYATNARRMRITGIVASGSLFVGALFGVSAAARVGNGHSPGFDGLAMTSLAFGGAGLASLLPYNVFRFHANRARRGAFTSYSNDLPTRLGFCADVNDLLYDCATGTTR